MRQSKNPRSFRLVCEMERIPLVEALLESEGFEFTEEPFCKLGRRLEAEPYPLGSSLAAFFGYIYIQDRSSMLPPLALAPNPGSAILDMCASPGGKSGFLAQLTGHGGFVLANEPNQARLATLAANMRQLNLPQVATSCHDGSKLPLCDSSWPFILLDPPCSGWGTEAKNPRVRQIWQGASIDRLTSLQRALLKKAARLLAPGGLLLYSTCTTNYDEDEAQTRFALEELGLIRQKIDPFPGFIYEERPGGEGCLLVAGKACQSQGFYLSLMRKPQSADPPAICGSQKFEPVDSACLASPIFKPDLPGIYALFGDKIHLIPGPAQSLLPANFRFRGFRLGSFKSDPARFKPDPRLRISFPEDAPKFVFEELKSLKNFLAGNSLMTKSATQGAISVWWKNLPLGSCQIKKDRLISGFGPMEPLKTG